MDNCDCQLSDVQVLTEDALLDPSVANSKLAKKKLKIEKIEENENGEKKDAVAFAREDESRAGMCESQVTGTASSYARKYAICSLLAINEEQDPDSMDNRPKKAVNEPKKDNLTVLTEFSKKKTEEGENRSELGKFYKFYSVKCPSWQGNFPADKLWNKWNTK